MATQATIEALELREIRFLTGAAAQEAAAINAGTSTEFAYSTALANQIGVHCTQPALCVSNYIEGVVPASGTLTVRAVFCQQQYNAYVAQGVADPSIGPYEALGSAFANVPAFTNLIAGKTATQNITAAYLYAIPSPPSPPGQAQIDHFTAQYNYFNNLYITAGIAPAQANLQAWGAVIGQIIGVGGTQFSKLNTPSLNWMINAGFGNAPAYSVPLF